MPLAALQKSSLERYTESWTASSAVRSLLGSTTSLLGRVSEQRTRLSFAVRQSTPVDTCLAESRHIARGSRHRKRRGGTDRDAALRFLVPTLPRKQPRGGTRVRQCSNGFARTEPHL